MVMKNSFLATALAMAFVIGFTILATTEREETLLVPSNKDVNVSSPDGILSATLPTTRASRFLVQEDPRPMYHCKKDYDVCREEGSAGATCCNNKCVNVRSDSKNCGACKKKCKYTESCCNGACVNLAFDKRHCGKCFNKCMQGGYCIYSMCDYA